MIWAASDNGMRNRLIKIYNECLKKGIFPKDWKLAKLVLIPKPGRPENSLSTYRPICLFNEIRQIFERIIADRLIGHLDREGPNFSSYQFGFRTGKFTIDAFLRIRSITEDLLNDDKMVLAISLDITNAFNTVTWEANMKALVKHNIPVYVCYIIKAYLSDRSITFSTNKGWTDTRRINRGVPQGSVLGPLLWNLAYDHILKARFPRNVFITC